VLLLVFLQDIAEGQEITIEYNVLDMPRTDTRWPWREVRPRPVWDSKPDFVEYGTVSREEWYIDETSNTYKVGDPDDMAVSCRLEEGIEVPFVTCKTRIFPNGSNRDIGEYADVCRTPYHLNGIRGGPNWRKFREVQRRRYGFACQCDRECFQRCIVEAHGAHSQLSELFADDSVMQSLSLLAPPKWSPQDKTHDIRDSLAMYYKATVGTALNVLMVTTQPDAVLEFDEIKNYFSFPLTRDLRVDILRRHMQIQGKPMQPPNTESDAAQMLPPSTESDAEVERGAEILRRYAQQQGESAEPPPADEQQCDGDEEMFDPDAPLGFFPVEEPEHVWYDMRRSDGLPSGIQNTGNSCFIAACVQTLVHSGCYNRLELPVVTAGDDHSSVLGEKLIAHLVSEMFHKLRKYENIGSLMLPLRGVFKRHDNDDEDADQNDALVFLNCAIRCIEAHAIPGTYKRIGVDLLTVTECAHPNCQNPPSVSAPTAYTDLTLRVQETLPGTECMDLQLALDAHMSKGPMVEWFCDEVLRPHCVGFVTQVCHETPRFLLLNFGRVQHAFQAHGSAQPDRKINHRVDFPLEFLNFGDVRNNKDEYGSYNLLSFIRHEDFNSGRSVEFSRGHYISIAHVKTADGASKWVEFNDSSVKIMSEEQVQSDIAKRSVVALLYERDNS